MSGQRDCRCARVHAELVVDAIQISLDRAFGDVQPGGNFFVALPTRYAREHFYLALSQPNLITRLGRTGTDSTWESTRVMMSA